MKARAMPASEMLEMMQHLMDNFLWKALGQQALSNATHALWDNLCKEHFRRMRPIHSSLCWQDVHFPFGISLDNAPIHSRSHEAVMAVRVNNRMEEYEPLFTAAELELELELNDAVRRATLINRLCLEAQATVAECQSSVVQLKVLMRRDPDSPNHGDRHAAVKRLEKQKRDAEADYSVFDRLLLQTANWSIARVFVEVSFPHGSSLPHSFRREGRAQRFLAE